MKYTALLFLFLNYTCFAGYQDRVIQYCLNNGVTNIILDVTALPSFKLQDDGGGAYISEWNLSIEKPSNDMLPSEEDSVNAMDNLWQINKPYALKMLENVYIDFLTNQWTSVLRSSGVISTNSVITVENTDEITNVGYLLYIRKIDFDTYNTMAGEFDRLKSAIIDYGGIMSKVIYHDL